MHVFLSLFTFIQSVFLVEFESVEPTFFLQSGLFSSFFKLAEGSLLFQKLSHCLPPWFIVLFSFILSYYFLPSFQWIQQILFCQQNCKTGECNPHLMRFPEICHFVTSSSVPAFSVPSLGKVSYRCCYSLLQFIWQFIEKLKRQWSSQVTAADEFASLEVFIFAFILAFMLRSLLPPSGALMEDEPKVFFFRFLFPALHASNYLAFKRLDSLLQANWELFTSIFRAKTQA